MLHAQKAATSRQIRRLEQALCAEDILHWVRQWCWTFDPREPSAALPFDPFAKQEEFLGWLAAREAAREDGLLEKSRDMGATWLCCLYAVHGWLYRPGYTVGFGSRKLELVDRLGDPKCIFEKIRFLLEHLPPWMLPAGYRRGEHALFCRVLNPANGATITGEGGDDIGRGGRTSIYFVDESAYLERPLLVERSLSQTTNCRIDVSTPNGPGNPFASKRFSGAVPVFTLHWKDDPRKGQDWYDYQKRVKYVADPVGLAQEVDIDYTASIEGITIPAAWVRAAVGLELAATGPVTAGLDIAEYGRDSCAFVDRQGPVVHPPVTWGQCNTTQTAHRAREEAQKRGVSVLNYDVGGVGAGVRGTWESSDTPLPFEAQALNAGESPTNTVWPDGRTSRDLFANLKAELWWLLRLRFEKTFERVEQGIAHPDSECISLPSDPELIAQLSLPLFARTASGKIEIESKKKLRARGVKSPDRAEALCHAFYPESAIKYDIVHLSFAPEKEEMPTPLKHPEIRQSPNSSRYQAVPVVGEEKLYISPDFRDQAEAGYASLLCHALLEGTGPVPADLPCLQSLKEEQKAPVEASVRAWLAGRGYEVKAPEAAPPAAGHPANPVAAGQPQRQKQSQRA